MAPSCALCGLSFERAQGYWVGAIYLNYAATVVIALGGALSLWGLVGIFPLWFFRYSRSLWLAVELLLNPEL
jgi:hypothetical protein